MIYIPRETRHLFALSHVLQDQPNNALYKIIILRCNNQTYIWKTALRYDYLYWFGIMLMNRGGQVQIHLGLSIIFTELNGKNTHSFYNSKLHTCIFDIYYSYGSCYISKSSDFPLILETSSMVKRATLTCPLTMRRNRAKNFKAYISLISVLKMFQNQHYLINMKVIIFSAWL